MAYYKDKSHWLHQRKDGYTLIHLGFNICGSFDKYKTTVNYPICGTWTKCTKKEFDEARETIKKLINKI